MSVKQMIAVFVQTPPPLWLKITKEVSWAYRLNKPCAPTIGFVMGRGKGLLPSKQVWIMLCKEVNRKRRNARAREASLIASQAREKHREYMRLYMSRKRRSDK